MGTPQYIRLTARPQKREPAASEVKAIRFGNAAPSPTPVSRRASSSVGKLHASAVTSENRPNSSTDPNRMRLRPWRSASMLPTSAPGSRPRIPALKIQPICILSSAKACAMPTAAIPAACRSSPSIRATIKQSPMVTTRREGFAVVILVIGYLGDSRTNGAGDWRLMLCQPHVLSYLLRLSRSSATSTIISSWPPTIRRLPSSTRISTALRP